MKTVIKYGLMAIASLLIACNNDDDNDKDNDNDNDNDNEGPCYGRGWLHLLAKPLYVSLMRVHQALQLRSYPTIAYLHPMSTVVLHVCLL